MKVKQTIPKHHIAELLQERGMGAVELANMIGITKSYMSKLINRKAAVTTALGLQIGNALGVDPHKVVELPFGRTFKALEDEALLGSALTWLLEAAERNKMSLSHAELSQWAAYVYKSALEEKLNFNQTKFFANAVIDIIRRVEA